MTTRTYPLDADADAVFDASGRAAVSVGPGRTGITWRPTIVAVSTSVGGADPAEARLYLDSTTSGRLLAGTRSGGQDSTETPGVVLTAGRKLAVEWTGGTPGAVASMSVTGSFDVTGRR